MAERSTRLVGKRFGYSVVIEDSGERTKSREILWTVRCDCGSLRKVPAGNLRPNSMNSCGCYCAKQSREYHREQTKDIEPILRALVEAGLTTTGIVDETGWSVAKVRMWLRRLGLQRPQGRPGSPKVDEPREPLDTGESNGIFNAFLAQVIQDFICFGDDDDLFPEWAYKEARAFIVEGGTLQYGDWEISWNDALELLEIAPENRALITSMILECEGQSPEKRLEAYRELHTELHWIDNEFEVYFAGSDFPKVVCLELF